MREIVSVELPSDYIKAINYVCLKLKISQDIFLKYCIESIVFGGSFSTDCDIDEVWEELEKMGLKPDVDEETKDLGKKT